MFEGIRKLFGGGNVSTGNNPAQEKSDALTAPGSLKPWED